MISVTDALVYIKHYQADFGTETVLLLQSPGRILAQDVFADRDFPPFHRVTMDGIALNSHVFERGQRDFKIEKIQPAGHPQQQLEVATQCIEVMTGAILPQGTDVVIPYEDCTLDQDVATVDSATVSYFQNVHRQGTDGKCGDLLLCKGQRISAAMIGIMASVGLDIITVQRLPKIAVCATGDELVDIVATPEIHQLRRSNSYMLAAALQEEGIAADNYHLPDDRVKMHSQLTSILSHYEVLLFSGAVSKGKYDLLPEVLTELGMHTIFHRIAQKPGKPFLFGQLQSGQLIFGFPGNPVSTLVCYRLFFQSWLYQSLHYQPALLQAQLTTQVDFKPALTYHLLVTLTMNGSILTATPCAGANSGDLLSLEKAHGLLSLPAEKAGFRPGEAYPLILMANFF